jgi:hypothetical protein
MTIQSILKMTGTIALAILTALYNGIVEGLARFGCGMVGLPYPDFEHFDQ